MVTVVSLFQLRDTPQTLLAGLCLRGSPSPSDAFLLCEERVFFLDLGTGGVEEGVSLLLEGSGGAGL